MKEGIAKIPLAVICVAWIIIDAIIKDDLFKWNHSFAYDMQKGDSDTSMPKYMIFTIISYLGQEELIAFFVLVGYVFCSNKIQALKVLIGTLISGYILSLLKLWYNEPRPYFVYSDLQGVGCDLEFGKPSGHTMVTAVLYFLLFDSVVNKKFFDCSSTQKFAQGCKQQTSIAQVVDLENPSKQQQKEDNEVCENPTKNSYEETTFINQERFVTSYVYLPAYLVLAFLIGFSRIILGAHTFGQVLVGWAYSTLFILFYRWKLENWIENALHVVTYKKFSSKKQVYSMLLSITLIYIVSMFIGVISYYLVDRSITDTERVVYQANIEKHSYCKDAFNKHKFLAAGCLLDCGILSLIYGVFLCALSMKGSYQPELWSKNYRPLRISKKILRIIVIGILVAVPYVVTSVYTIDDHYLYFFFRNSLRYFFIAVFLIKLAPSIYKFTKLEIDGDYLKCLPNSSFFDNPYNSNDYIEPSIE